MANLKTSEKKSKAQSMGMHTEVLTGRTQQKFFNPDEAENFYYFGTYDVDFNKRMSTHEVMCDERWKTCFSRLDDLDSNIGRLETIAIGACGAIIVGSVGVIISIHRHRQRSQAKCGRSTRCHGRRYYRSARDEHALYDPALRYH